MILKFMNVTWTHFFGIRRVSEANLESVEGDVDDEDEDEELETKPEESLQTASDPVRKVTISGAAPGLW